jgi:hypothetical protein
LAVGSRQEALRQRFLAGNDGQQSFSSANLRLPSKAFGEGGSIRG